MIEQPLQIVITKNRDGYKIGIMGLDDKGSGTVLRNHYTTDLNEVLSLTAAEAGLLEIPEGVL